MNILDFGPMLRGKIRQEKEEEEKTDLLPLQDIAQTKPT